MLKQNAGDEYLRWLKMGAKDCSMAWGFKDILADKSQIEDCFGSSITFGTGGLRGVMGVGPNRINTYTIAWASRAVAAYLKEANATTVCIAYDTRQMSKEFAKIATAVFCDEGIRVYFFAEPRPTPMLSFMVKHKGADAGIVITASHNPKEYNGYKVYDSDGGQITDGAAQTILSKMQKIDVLDSLRSIVHDHVLTDDLVDLISHADEMVYFNKLKTIVLRHKLIEKEAAQLCILYTPLHGTGSKVLPHALDMAGFKNVEVVREQQEPNGDFPTCARPNPEEPQAFYLALEQAKRSNPDLVFATDPDCDRIGVASRDSAGKYVLFTGNQVGALLCEYIVSTRKAQELLGKNPVVLKTIVTGDLAKKICRAHGVALFETLTGFKYIAEKVIEWENDRRYHFLFGFEESCGYLAGNFVRDKDAMIAALLIAEMALYHKTEGKTLQDALEDIYRKYGYAADKLVNVDCSGAAGKAAISYLMDWLREQGAFAFPQAPVVYDYSKTLETGLPASNVMKYVTAEGWMVFRPSGTEPKMKIYIHATGSTAEHAEKHLEELLKISNHIRHHCNL